MHKLVRIGHVVREIRAWLDIQTDTLITLLRLFELAAFAVWDMLPLKAFQFTGNEIEVDRLWLAAASGQGRGAVHFLSNFIHQRVTEKNKQKTIYNKHQNTSDMQDYQAVTCM